MGREPTQELSSLFGVMEEQSKTACTGVDRDPR